MVGKPAYTVHIVVDAAFGERLTALPVGEPVWIVQSPVNTPVVRRLWAERPSDSHLTGITHFTPSGATPEEALLSVLDTVDLHHGEHSADPPYSKVIVYGAPLTPGVSQAFMSLGFDISAPDDGWLIAERRVS